MLLITPVGPAAGGPRRLPAGSCGGSSPGIPPPQPDDAEADGWDEPNPALWSHPENGITSRVTTPVGRSFLMVTSSRPAPSAAAIDDAASHRSCGTGARPAQIVQVEQSARFALLLKQVAISSAPAPVTCTAGR